MIKKSKDELLEQGYAYLDERGRFVFTAKYHLERGKCCKPKSKNKCKHCPYK